jgi:hypothetical protein
MEQIDASILLGVARSNVFTMLGQPTYTSTNCGPASNWIADDYIKFAGLGTDGFTFVYSNNALIQKHPILSGGP